MTHRNRARRLAAATLLLAVVAVAGGSAATPAEARGGAARPAAPAANPNMRLGAALFDQCIRWVSRGQRGITRTTDFHIAVTAELELDTARHRGPMRLWWKAPDKYRQELETSGRTTAKVLNGDFLWIVHPGKRVQRMHGTAEGAGSIRQLKEDRQRMADLAQFITLRSLKGPRVTFEFVGEKKGSGDYAGNWVKITRRAPGAAVMHFWLAYQKDREGRYLATWPGIVRIDGDARKRIPTEDFILRNWTDAPKGQPHTFRYPRFIQAYSRMAGQAPVRFLRATVNDIRINAGIKDTQFKPPLPSGR